MTRRIIAVFLLVFLASPAGASEEDLQACAKFGSDLWKLLCYEAVAGHSGKPEQYLIIIPPPPPPVPVPPTREEICRTAYAFALTVMAERQSGKTMPDMIEQAGDDPNYKAIVRAAFNVGLGSNSGARNAEIDRFANDYYSDCISE